MKKTIVIGPPGTGKTEYIRRQVAKAVEKYGRNRIAILSLTRSSAQVAAGRIELPDTAIGTLHSFCYRSLSNPEIAELNLKSWNAQFPELAIKETKRNLDFSADEVSGNNDTGSYMLALINNIRQKRLDPQTTTVGKLNDFYQLWEQWKIDNDYIDFTDLIENSLRDIEHLPNSPKAIFVDEAQDLSRLEVDLINKWSRYSDNLIMVGDRLQALFTWRSADPFYALPDDEKTIQLKKSYRCPQLVVDRAINYISKSVEYRDENYSGLDDKPGSTIETLPYGISSGAVVGKVHSILSENPEETVMLLATCSYMLNGLIRNLRDNGMLFHNPYRTIAGNWNPVSEARGGAKNRILSMLKVSRGDIWTARDVVLWSEPLAKECFNSGGKAALKKINPDISAEKLITEIKKNVKQETIEKLADGNVDWYFENIVASKKQGFEYPLKIYQRYGITSLEQEPRIIVGTVHSVKGGEADHVFILPDLSQSAYWDGMKDSYTAARRVFYVAMTRARKSLYFLATENNLTIGN